MSLICIDARYLRERPSGIGAMVDVLVRELPALMPTHQFLLLRHPKARARLSNEANVREVTLSAEANGPGTLLILPRLVDLSAVELFHAPFNILPAGLTMRTVTTIHDVMWLAQPELCRSPGVWGRVEQAFYRNGIRRALASSTQLITVSDATKSAMAAIDSRASERTTVIHHGVDGRFSPAITDDDLARVEAVRRTHAPGARRYVLTVGQAAGYKNQTRAVEAFLAAFRDDPSTHLILVQRLGQAATELLELARSHHADGRVHVLPSLPFDDLIALYRGALCLCHPSLVEGWGMPISEAMASGCPVVTSDRSAMPEVAGGAAMLVDPTSVQSIAAALASMGSSPREPWIARGLARARQLSWSGHAAKTADVFLRSLAV